MIDQLSDLNPSENLTVHNAQLALHLLVLPYCLIAEHLLKYESLQFSAGWDCRLISRSIDMFVIPVNKNYARLYFREI